LSIGYCFRKIVFNISEVIRSFFSASVTTIAVYISYLVQREVSTSVLYSAYYGIKWEPDLNIFTSIFSEQFIQMILEGSVRILSKPVQKERTNNLRYIKDSSIIVSSGYYDSMTLSINVSFTALSKSHDVN
jgi:hypothetical protein